MSVERLTLSCSQESSSVVLTGFHQIDSLGWYLLPQLTEERHVSILVAKQTWEQMGARVRAALTQHSIEHSIILLPNAADKLNFACAAEVLDALSHSEETDASTVLIIGNEELIELGLFVASSFDGGMQALVLPTTLFAMISTSLKDQWALEIARGRRVCASAQAHTLVVSLEQIAGMDALSYQAGLVEMVRLALLEDEPALFWLIDHAQELNVRNQITLREALQRAQLSQESALQAGFIRGSRTSSAHGLAEALSQSLLSSCPCHSAQARLEALRLSLRLSCEKTGLDPEVMVAVEELLTKLGCSALSPQTNANTWINKLFEPLAFSGQELTLDLLAGVGKQERVTLDKSFVKPRIAAWCAAKVE